MAKAIVSSSNEMILPLCHQREIVPRPSNSTVSGNFLHNSALRAEWDVL
jgi:hypothetical protein